MIKKQILDYNKKMNLVYVNDPSNDDEKYSRVVIRNFIKKNWVVIKIINGNTSNKIEGKFNIVNRMGNPIPISLLLLKNFNSSKIFRTNISEEKTNVT